jgi:hypothetical protein
MFVANLALATMEGKFGLESAIRYTLLTSIDPPNDSVDSISKHLGGSSHKDSREELIYMDDVGADGSIRRTYFKNIDQLGRVLQNTEETQGLATHISEKELEETKRKLKEREDLFVRSEPEPKVNLHEPGIYLNQSHPEIKEALMAQEEEEETSNVLHVDFDELFQSSNSVKKAGAEEKAFNVMISCGVQTEQEQLPIVCSKCLRCGERTDVKVKLDFGDTPVKHTAISSFSKTSVNKLASGHVYRPNLKQSDSKLLSSKEDKFSSAEVNRRLLFRHKPVTSPQQPRVDLVKLETAKSGPSASKLNQKTYLKHFEAQRNLKDNSDMKYFSGGRRNMSQHSLVPPSDNKKKSLNKSTSYSELQTSQKKSPVWRSIGHKKWEEPSLDLGLEVSLDSLIMEGSSIEHTKDKIHRRESKSQWPMEVDIDLGDITVVADHSYVRKRDSRTTAFHKNTGQVPPFKRNWKTAAIN